VAAATATSRAATSTGPATAAALRTSSGR
jgi:hypothetical protein